MRLHYALWLAAAFGSVFGAAGPGNAQAQAKRAAALNWVRMPGAESCVDGVTLAASVEQRLGGRVFFAPAEATLVVEGHAERTQQGYRALLRIADPEGTALGDRELQTAGKDCTELGETVVLVLAVMIDPDGEVRSQAAPAPVPEPPAAPPEPPPAPTCPDPEPCPEPPATPPATDGPTWKGGFGMLGAASLDQLPSPALNLLLHGRLEHDRWGALHLSGAMSSAVNEPLLAGSEVEGGQSVRGRFDVWYVGVDVCPLNQALGPVSLGLCAGVQMGRSRVEVRGAPEARERVQEPWLNARAGLFAEARLFGPLRLHLGVGMGALLLRTTLRAQVGDASQATDLHRPANFNYRGEAGLVAVFPR